MVEKLTRILTLFGPMEFSIKLHAIKSGWSIVYIEGPHVMVSKDVAFISLKIDLALPKSAKLDLGLLTV